MKRIASIILALCLIGALCAGCTWPELSGPKYARGINTDTGFSSEYLDLRFTAPYQYRMVGNDEIASMAQQGASFFQFDQDVDAEAAATYCEMMAVHSNGDPMLMVVVDRARFNSGSAEKALKDLQYQLNINLPGVYRYKDEIVDVTVAGQQYKQCTVTAEKGHIVFVQDIMMRKQGSRLICIMLFYFESQEAEARDLLSCLKTY